MRCSNFMAGLAAALVVAGTALAAAADPMAGAYGNTVVVTGASGEKTKLWIAKDGTYTGETPSGEKFTGRWLLKANDTKFCWKDDMPADAPKGTLPKKEWCAELQPRQRKAGDKWRQKDWKNDDITVEVVPGM